MKAALLILLLALAGPAAAAPFTWQLQGPRATHHLVGSVHLLPEQAQPLSQTFGRALAASAVLVLESDIAGLAEPEMQAQMLGAAQNPEGLQAEAGAALYADTRRRLLALGLPPALCDSLRAWFCAMTLEVMGYTRAGFKPELGIDQQLFEAARAAGKPVQWFEPLPEHLGLFTGMTPGMSRELLASTLDELEQGRSSPEKLLELWRGNDLAAVARLVARMKADHPQVHDRLLSARNRRWLPQLETLLRGDRPVLVAVGAAHYAGPEGLLALLRARGFKPQPLPE